MSTLKEHAHLTLRETSNRIVHKFGLDPN